MTHPVCFKQIMLMLVSTVNDGDEAMMKTLMIIDDKVTSNGGSVEKFAKSRGSSEGDGRKNFFPPPGRKDVGGVQAEPKEADTN